MDRIVAMQVFCKVVESGSFVMAAERMDLSTSAVSRLVVQLESHLQTRLLNRTTRQISLTDEGRSYYERCVQLLLELEEIEDAMAHTSQALRGQLRLTLPISFGDYLAPALAQFSQEHPQLKLEVNLSDQQIDLIEEGLDLAIRVGHLGSQNLVARRLGQTQLLICAAPQYLAQHGTPKQPSDLLQHQCLLYGSTEWPFTLPEGQTQTQPVSGQTNANNGLFLRELAIAGAGITMAPDFLLADAVRDGRLIPILADYPSPPLPIYAVYPSRRHLAARVRSFVQFLQNWLPAAQKDS